jgi:putative transcriptional regulator
MKATSALAFNPDRMISELEQLVTDRQKGQLAKYRVTEIDVPAIRIQSAGEILALREHKLRMSRAAFAKVLNVPPATLRAWECGKRNPSGAAIRLLDLVHKLPLHLCAEYLGAPVEVKEIGTSMAVSTHRFSYERKR